MTLIDKLRFHNILTQGGIPEAPSIEFTEALQDTFDDQTSELATKTDVKQAIKDAVSALKQDAAEREARYNHRLLVIALGVVGVNITIVSAGVGIILAFN